MIFSLLCPTRGRLEKVRNFVNSVHQMTKNLDEIEILFACDEDHSTTVQNLEKIKEDYKDIKIRIYTRPRSDFMNRDYYNWIGEKAEGEFVWMIADDLLLLVNQWDEIIKNKLKDFLSDKPDNIVCASILDDTPAPGEPPGNKLEFPCFPMFSKEVKKVLGFYLPPQLPTWGADKYTYNLFNPIGRMFFIHDVCYINHIGYHSDFKKVEPDELTVRAGEICAKYSVDSRHKPHDQGDTIKNQQEILNRYIKTKRT